MIEYRKVAGFSFYRVGSNGTVWSIRGRGNGTYKNRKAKKWRKINPGTHKKSGHLLVTLVKNGKTFWFYVHTLVLETFKGPRPVGYQARHFPDRDPSNNSIENLSWASPKKNQRDRIFHGTDNRGEKHGKAKVSERRVLKIRKLYRRGWKVREICNRYSLSYNTVYPIVRGNTWKHLL